MGEQGSLGREIAKLQTQIKEMENRLNEVINEKENLQYELERRAMKGDYNPSDTKVLHFKNNPLQQAAEEHESQLNKIQTENESLKARIKLLEEGHSKDLTILVGQKMEEDASSQEVQDLRDQIKSRDLQRQRLLEAFQKTSKSFREVCCQLTGYRIDGLQNNQYRLTPSLAENPSDDNLLFRLEEGGELSMLDTSFSSQLTELIELHLRRQNSIPVFLAAVIMDLFSRQTFDTFQESQSETAASEVHPQGVQCDADNHPSASSSHQHQQPQEIDEYDQQTEEQESYVEDEESSVDLDDMSAEGEEEEIEEEESLEDEEEGKDEDEGQGDDDNPICID